MIRTLTGLRSVLFLFIFCTHFRWNIIDSEIGKNLFEILFLGRYGVLFFFLLSGFCIAMGYSHIFSVPSRKNYINFLKRRLIKLYPLYMLSGLVSLIFIDFPQNGIEMVYSYLISYLPMIQSWGIVNIIGLNNVGWFVSCLFFCYILTPFILILLNRIKDIRFHLLFCSVNYIILLLFSLYLAAHNYMQNSFLYGYPPIRIFEYMIAIDFGLIYVKILKNNMNWNISYSLKSCVDILFVLLFIFCIFWLPNNVLTRHIFAMPLFCCFLLYLCYEKRSILYDFFSSKFCNFIGNISYECFLIHFLVLEILKPYYQKYIYTTSNIIILFLSLFAISVLISYLYKVFQNKIFQVLKINKPII